MHKKCVLFLTLVMVVLVAFSSQALASKITKITIEEGMQREKLVDPFDHPYTTGQGIPFQSGTVLTSPGEVVGTSHYDIQTNGSTGNGIDFWEGNRWVYYNFRDETGVWSWPGAGTQVNTTQGAGYTQLNIMSDGRAVPSYHSVNNTLYTCIALDIFRGFGDFTEIDVSDVGPGPNYYIWPYETIDRNDRIHILCTERVPNAGDPHIVIYTRSADEGNTWIDPEIVDTTFDVSAILTSSRVSDKVSLAYTEPRSMDPHDQYNNDMAYYESLDGVTWDWSNMINVTNYQLMDTLRAYCDCDAVYDYNDNLHLLWNTPYYDEPNSQISPDACLLWHWSEATGITLVANGWWESTPGTWNRTISKMSLGVDENNNLYALWTQFTNDDRSAQGRFSNGELYVCGSRDGGATWYSRINVTNSPTPDCWAGECESDHWSSLAETVDDSLHITYINDKDAGGIPVPEGVDTENPVMYLAVDTLIVWTATGVKEEEVSLPATFGLKQNYPNPFNASTTIEYVTRTFGKVELAVYNLVGEKVEVLVDKVMPPGEHTVTWDAGSVASGVYYYKLTTSEGAVAKRMLLVK